MATVARKSKEGANSPETIQQKQQDTCSLPIDPAIKPSKLCKLLIFYFVGLFYLIFYHYQIELELKISLLFSSLISFGGFFATTYLIPLATKYLFRRNLFTYDTNTNDTPQASIQVPKQSGIVVATVFFMLVVVFESFLCLFYKTLFWEWYEKYNLALASICIIILLGFVDDVLDLPWGVKFFLPLIAIHPLLMAYDEHSTITKPVIPFIGLEVLNPVWMFKLYMGILALFCTNSIKYHTGLNGLKAGQTAVISFAVLVYNIIQIGSSTNPKYQLDHAFSIILVHPLLTTTLALLSFNWYPSSVFVGDTYTYFAGTALLLVGILGNFSETLIIFFTPQILNFLAWVPQHFGFIKSPHHSPSFDPQTGLLTGTKGGTLVNIFLRCFGQCSEKSLCLGLLAFQALCCITAVFPHWMVK